MEGYQPLRRGDLFGMTPAMAETILGVDKRLLKTCQQYIQEIWYYSRGLPFVTTAQGTNRFNEHVTDALNIFLLHSPRHDAVAEIYYRAATLDNINNMVSHRCQEVFCRRGDPRSPVAGK
jgi:hypothetical protein